MDVTARGNNSDAQSEATTTVNALSGYPVPFTIERFMEGPDGSAGTPYEEEEQEGDDVSRKRHNFICEDEELSVDSGRLIEPQFGEGSHHHESGGRRKASKVGKRRSKQAGEEAAMLLPEPNSDQYLRTETVSSAPRQIRLQDGVGDAGYQRVPNLFPHTPAAVTLTPVLTLDPQLTSFPPDLPAPLNPTPVLSDFPNSSSRQAQNTYISNLHPLPAITQDSLQPAQLLPANNSTAVSTGNAVTNTTGYISTQNFTTPPPPCFPSLSTSSGQTARQKRQVAASNSTSSQSGYITTTTTGFAASNGSSGYAGLSSEYSLRSDPLDTQDMEMKSIQLDLVTRPSTSSTSDGYIECDKPNTETLSKLHQEETYLYLQTKELDSLSEISSNSSVFNSIMTSRKKTAHSLGSYEGLGETEVGVTSPHERRESEEGYHSAQTTAQETVKFSFDTDSIGYREVNFQFTD